MTPHVSKKSCTVGYKVDMQEMSKVGVSLRETLLTLHISHPKKMGIRNLHLNPYSSRIYAGQIGRNGNEEDGITFHFRLGFKGGFSRRVGCI